MVIYTGWVKNGANLHFPQYLENYQRYLYDFLPTSGSVTTKHVYNVLSFLIAHNASRGIATVSRPSVRPSVCLSVCP